MLLDYTIQARRYIARALFFGGNAGLTSALPQNAA